MYARSRSAEVDTKGTELDLPAGACGDAPITGRDLAAWLD